MMKKRAVIQMTLLVDLDPVPGVCHQAEDFVTFMKSALDGAKHYHPDLQVRQMGHEFIDRDLDGKIAARIIQVDDDAWLILDQDGISGDEEYPTADAAKRAYWDQKNGEGHAPLS